MSLPQKSYETDNVEYAPPLKKRRISTKSNPILSQHRSQHNNNNNLTSSQFSCAESSQLSHHTQSQSSQTSEQKVSQAHVRRLFSDCIADVLLQEILSYATPFELSVCSVVCQFYNSQCVIIWQRLNKCCISPQLFPSLIEDDYDSQFEYNPAQYPPRPHFTLNWLIHKLQQCMHLQHLKIQRTMLNGQMFQILVKNCPHLRTLHLDENPWIFLLGKDKINDNLNYNNHNNSMDIDNEVTQQMQMYSANLFQTNSQCLPQFKLEKLIIESQYMNMTDITFHHLLFSSRRSLQQLILKKRDPFACSFCGLLSLCKWHKCDDCGLHNYCSRKCQLDDWCQHQYVCSYHSNHHTNIRNVGNVGNVLNGGFLDSICLLKHLVTIDLTWCYNVNDHALQEISEHCQELKNIFLNGCYVTNNGIIALANNLKCIQKLHCRVSYVTDTSVNILCEKHKDNLIDLDISRCYLITKQSVVNLINECKKLVHLSIACGLKMGGWMWTLDDNMCDSIVKNLKCLKNLQYLCANNGQLSVENEKKLFHMNKDIKIQKITTDKQIEWRNVNGQIVETFVKESSKYDNPVLMQCIVNGTVVYEHRFKR